MSHKKKRERTNPPGTLYPDPSAGRMTYYALRRWLLLALGAVFLICLAINLATGWPPWCLYALLAEYIGYSAFRSRDLLKNNPPHWALKLLSGLCLLLIVVEWGQGSAWTPLITAPLIMLGALVAGTLLTFGVRRRPPLLPLARLIILSLLVCAMAFVGPWLVSWAHLLLLGAASALAFAVLLGKRRALAEEIKKRFRA